MPCGSVCVLPVIVIGGAGSDIPEETPAALPSLHLGHPGDAILFGAIYDFFREVVRC